MPGRTGNSLIGGRNRAPLDEDGIRRVTNTFIGLDRSIDIRHDPQSATKFVVIDDEGVLAGAIIFGSDIYPGTSVVDPNSALSMQAAAAHELTHYHRWHDRTELPFGDLDDLDEALTSLEASLRYERHLNEHEVRQLIRDAIQRIAMYVNRRLEEGDDE